MAALLWAITDITQKKATGELASTSAENKWLKPRKRKDSPKKAEDIVFKKVMKQKLGDKEKDPSKFRDFTPAGISNIMQVNADDFRKQMQEILPSAGFHKLFPKPLVSEELKKKFCIPDPPFQYHKSVNLNSRECVQEFKNFEKSLKFDCKEVEQLTRGQCRNDLWMLARKGRITASNFGTIFNNQGKKTESAVKTVMGYYTSPVSDALDWGRKHEKTAMKEYSELMKRKGHKIKIDTCGLVIDERFSFIGASPDGIVSCDGEIGLVEVKCPFTHKYLKPKEAASKKDFCCKLDNDKLVLKTNHSYFYQVQGQLALTGYDWCDFVIWTVNGISVERIGYDRSFWDKVCVKLVSFYRDFIVPEIYSSRVRCGIVPHNV